MVLPAWCSSRKIFRISRPVFLSRLPVGSSARIAGGFDRDGPRDGAALLLAAGELRGPVLHALAQTHALQRLARRRPPLRYAHALVDQGQFDIFERGELGQEVESLKNEANLPVADTGQLALAVLLDGLVITSPSLRPLRTSA